MASIPGGSGMGRGVFTEVPDHGFAAANGGLAPPHRGDRLVSIPRQRPQDVPADEPGGAIVSDTHTASPLGLVTKNRAFNQSLH